METVRKKTVSDVDIAPPKLSRIGVQAFQDKFQFNLLPLLIGVLSAQKIDLGGEIFIGELLFMLYFAFQFKNMTFTATEKNFLYFSLLWSAVQLLSDVINDSLLIDSIKGVLTPPVFSFTTLGLVSYFIKIKSTSVGVKERMPSFLIGVMLWQIIYALTTSVEIIHDNPWKWGVGGALINILAIYVSFFRTNINNLMTLLLLMFLVISLNFDARSLSLFPLVSYLIYSNALHGKLNGFQKLFSGHWHLIKILLLSGFVLVTLNLIATAIFSSDFVLSNLPIDAAAKYSGQAKGDLGVLLGGRSEVLVSFNAFLDKPLLGHGSWATDKTGEYMDAYLHTLYFNDYQVFDVHLDDLNLIPAHSFIMAALVWSGIFGGLFWLYILNILTKIYIKFISVLPYYFHLNTLILLWNIFFSPFGSSNRFSTTIFLSSFFAFIYYRGFNSEVQSKILGLKEG